MMRLRAGLRAWRTNSFGASPMWASTSAGSKRTRRDAGSTSAPASLQHRARLVMQEVDADLLQDYERGLMDRLELVARDEVERRERREGLAGGRCRGASAALDRAPASGAAPRILRRRVGRHVVPQDLRRPRARLATAPIAIGRKRRSSGAAYTRLAPKWHCGMPIRAKASRRPLFCRPQLRRFRGDGFRVRRTRGRAGGKPGDEPGAEQRHSLVAEVLGMRSQIVAVALVQP